MLAGPTESLTLSAVMVDFRVMGARLRYGLLLFAVLMLGRGGLGARRRSSVSYDDDEEEDDAPSMVRATD